MLGKRPSKKTAEAAKLAIRVAANQQQIRARTDIVSKVIRERPANYPASACFSCSGDKERAFMAYLKAQNITLSRGQWQIVLAVMRAERTSADVSMLLCARRVGTTYVFTLLEHFFKFRGETPPPSLP